MYPVTHSLEGRRALVCGSSQGIGRACAKELAARGATVILTARTEAALEQVHGELSTDSGEFSRFTFFVPVPGLRLDHHEVDFATLYPDEEIRDYPKEELIGVCEKMREVIIQISHLLLFAHALSCLVRASSHR